MSRILCTFTFSLGFSSALKPNNLFFFHHLRCSPSPARLVLAQALRSSTSLPMPINKGKAGTSKKRWTEEAKSDKASPHPEGVVTTEDIVEKLGKLSVTGNISQSQFPIQVGSVSLGDQAPMKGHKGIWKPKAYSTARGSVATDVHGTATDGIPTEIYTRAHGAECRETASVEKIGSSLTKLFKGPLGEDFIVDNLTYASAQIRATFYPKFENEKSDQEVRTRIIQMVSNGQATLEVSLKHSGSLFMYAGHEGGAYAKNSYGNIYTAVGVFVLGKMFLEAWGTEARKKQAEFNQFLERNHMCISMELVTAVLGDHGQRPLEDYVVVTAVTELGKGKPKFYSTPEIIAFCRKWRLPTNHVWLFSTRKSATSFFAVYDALCEEGTATSVCRALDEVADISVPGSKDHIKVQGEILEGLVARIVSRQSTKHMEKVLSEFPPPPLDAVGNDLGLSLREICAGNRSDEKQQIKALLQGVGTSMCPDYIDWTGDVLTRNADRSVLSKFLQAHPADHSTIKLQGPTFA